jgi:uncharacterized protein YndB with AHSA1/START domain
MTGSLVNRPPSPLATVVRTGGTVSARFEREYATDVDDAWSVLTEPDRVARWLASVTIDSAGAGGGFRLAFGDGEARFAIDECDPPRTLAVRWLHGDGDSAVRVDLAATGERSTRLTLQHSRLEPRTATGYAAGWHVYLDALRAHVEGGTAPDWDVDWPRLESVYRETLD